MTRARNLAGLSTVTAQPTVTTPVHLGPLGVVTATRYYGTFDETNIISTSIATTDIQISGITTGLNVSGIITAQDGTIVSGVSTFLGSQSGLNVTGVATFASNVSIAGTLTYEDVTAVDVVGVATFQSDINIADKIIHSGDANTMIRFPSVDTFTVETAGSERVRVHSTGLLELKVPDSVPTLRLTPAGTNANSAIDFNTPGTGSAVFKVQNSEKLRITSAGDVGIGTIAPTNTGAGATTGNTATLAVGIITCTTITANKFYGDGSGLTNTVTTINNNADNRLITGSGTANTLNGEDTLTYDGTSLLLNKIAGNIKVRSAAQNVYGQWYTGNAYTALGTESNDYLYFFTNGLANERMRIDSAGKVGIGTDNPASKTVIAGSDSGDVYLQIANATTGYDANSGFLVGLKSDEGATLYQMENNYMRFGTNGTERLRITGDGPHLLLGGTSDVNEITETSSNTGMVIGDTSMGNGGIAIINSTTGTGRIYFGDATGSDAARNRGQINYYHNGDYMMFATAGSERLRIKSDGEVLMGTTTDRPVAGQGYKSSNGWFGALQLEKANPAAGNNSVPFFAITAFNGANEKYTGGISFNRSNNNTQGTHTLVTTSQQLGNISFNGSDGTAFIPGAEIYAKPDETPGTNDMPTAIHFGCTPDGAAACEDAMVIKSHRGINVLAKWLGQDGSGTLNVGNGNVSLADESQITLSGAANTGCLIAVGINKGATGNITYDHGLFFCSYGVTNAVEVADPGGDFSNSDSDGHFCVFTAAASGAYAGDINVKNRLGHTTLVSISLIRFVGN